MTDRDESSEGFLERWSRKKIDAEQEATADPAARNVVPADQADPVESREGANAAAAPKPEFDLASLPSLDSITAATDIRAFLGSGVPKELARAALRRAWSADPAIRDFKGLAENDWDFTDPNAVAGFGELPADFDLKKMVGQIFGDSEKPADLPGQPRKEQETHIVEETGPSLPAEPETSAANDEKPSTPQADQKQISSTVFVQRDNNTAAHKSNYGDDEEEQTIRRQHGGALPQ